MLGVGKHVELDKMEIDMAHWCMLKNCEGINSYIEYDNSFFSIIANFNYNNINLQSSLLLGA